MTTRAAGRQLDAGDTGHFWFDNDGVRFLGDPLAGHGDTAGFTMPDDPVIVLSASSGCTLPWVSGLLADGRTFRLGGVGLWHFTRV